jgi:hypothetical protein
MKTVLGENQAWGLAFLRHRHQVQAADFSTADGKTQIQSLTTEFILDRKGGLVLRISMEIS